MRRSLLALALTMSAQVALAQSAPPLTTEEAHVVAEALEGAIDHGLPAPNISDDLVSAVLSYARAQTGQRLGPQDVNPAWAIEPRPRDVAVEFYQARQNGALGNWLDALPPADARYSNLISARRQYAAMVADGGWAALSATLREGDRGADVMRLRQRLEAEG